MLEGLLLVVIGLLWQHFAKHTPPPVPTTPTPRKKKVQERSPRPSWIAEVYMGKRKPTQQIKVYARTEGDAVMKLLAPPHRLEPKDIVDLYPSRG